MFYMLFKHNNVNDKLAQLTVKCFLQKVVQNILTECVDNTLKFLKNTICEKLQQSDTVGIFAQGINAIPRH